MAGTIIRSPPRADQFCQQRTPEGSDMLIFFSQIETPQAQAGVARIRRHRAVGTCDGYCLLAWKAVPYS